ncbi:MAG TPA: L-serine ammonia-lyase, iron-sulfur-dependent, subunit alpha [Elusimicrobiota bacterium]|nr:L-serine ammonia-lyase, iron-sulfur-dependent, subunit alpha [Elusimicrobiota bacterium]
MNLLKEVLSAQVYPAIGCTEPGAVALCASRAAHALGEPVRRAEIFTDRATYKNGVGVLLPNTAGGRGCLLAGTMGLFLAAPHLKMQLLKTCTPSLAQKAARAIRQGRVSFTVLPRKKGIHIEVRVEGRRHRATCIVRDHHNETSLLLRDDTTLIDRSVSGRSASPHFKKILKKISLRGLLRAAEQMDNADAAYIEEGVTTNLKAAEAGMALKKVGFYLKDLRKRGYLLNDVFSSTKIIVSCAVDARMAGCPVPVMCSGESGNQGIVAVLVPHNVGQAFKISRRRILKSIALSHLVNAYVKAQIGELSPLCGCAIAAGVGAAAAVAYQQKGGDLKAITLAINNVVSDIGGMLCDGAKSGCALKVVSSADCAIRSAYMAARHYGITAIEGFVGHTAEETIRNLAKIATVGMAQVDDTLVDIMRRKRGRLKN